jgi:mutator protein MutT
MMKLISLAIILRHVQKDSFEIWFQKRITKDALHNLWEMPGGKIEFSDSNSQSSIIRELKEEVNWEPQKGMTPFKIFNFKNEQTIFQFHTYIFTDLKGFDDAQGSWFKINYFEDLNFEGQIPPLNVQMIEDLKIYLSQNYNYFL